MYLDLHVKCPFFLSDITENSNSSTEFSRNREIPNFMEIRPVGAQMLRADGQTDMTKPLFASHNFPNALTYILMKILRV